MSRRRVFRHIFKFHGLIESFKFAFLGLYYLFLYHRNMRVIFMLGVAAFIFGFYLKLRGLELVILSIAITLVFMAEIFNTAIEMMMNMLSSRYRLRIKLVKDIAAAVVLLTVLDSLAVGYFLFIKKFR